MEPKNHDNDGKHPISDRHPESQTREIEKEKLSTGKIPQGSNRG
jgi:hypothetical protein